jgi:hypothetical protein
MRLNFSGVDENQIREGIRRLGEVVREQVALYGTLTGSHPVVRPATETVLPAVGPRPAPEVSGAEPESPGGIVRESEAPGEQHVSNVLRLPRTRAR